MPAPGPAIRTPARAGPTTREPVISALLRPTALGTSVRGTSSTTSARRDGLSKALIVPNTSDSTNSAATVMRSVSVSTDSVSASRRNAACVPIIMRWRSTRSAITPAHAPTSRIGRNSAAVTRPRATPLPVMSSTTQVMATDCIHVPAWLTSWPPKNRRKLRLPKDRKVSCPATRSRSVMSAARDRSTEGALASRATVGYGGVAPEDARSWSSGHHGGSGQVLEHVDGVAEAADSIGPELVEPRGEKRVAAFAAVLEPAAPLGGDRRPDDAAVGVVDGANDEPVLLEPRDHLRDRRGRDLLDDREVAEGDRSLGLYGCERRLLRRRQTRVGLLAKPAEETGIGEAQATGQLGRVARSAR